MTLLQTEMADIGLRALRTRFKGAVIEPGGDGWDVATQAYNLAFVQEPTIVAVPTDEQDVVTIVNFARERGLQVAAQRTGHNAQPLGAMDDVVLVKTDALQGVEIDVERRVARVASGSKWGDVVPRASELGLATLHGSTPDVSVAGYSLGGGVGWYARKLGLSANSVTAIELVTADGRLRRVASSTTRICSGPCGAAAATSASSPRSRSSCTRSRRCTRACSSSRGSGPPRCCTPGSSGRPRFPTR
jgi:hypothetical protein